MIPLTVTIMFTYGLIGLVGKDYDMPRLLEAVEVIDNRGPLELLFGS